MVRQCYTPIAARTVREALAELGCEAGPGTEEGRTAVYVYAYLKSSITGQGTRKKLHPVLSRKPVKKPILNLIINFAGYC
jgi:hypothetical protein